MKSRFFFSFFFIFFISIQLILFPGCSNNDRGSGEVSVGETPSPVSIYLVFPADGSVGLSPLLSFSWGVSDETSRELTFSLFIGTSPENLEEVADGIGKTTYSFSGTWGTTYYWKVVAYEGDSEVGESDVWKFTTDFVPSTFSLTSPENGFSVVPCENNRVHLVWESPEDRDNNIAGYEVYLGFSPDDMKLVAVTDTTSYYVGDLAELKTYYWRVVAFDSAGARSQSDIFSFRTESVLKQIRGFLPANGDYDISVNPVLRWGVGLGHLKYDLYFGDTSSSTDMQLLASGITTPVFRVTGLSPYTRYYWKVETRNECGEVVGTGILSFTTGMRLPPAKIIDATSFANYMIDEYGNLWVAGRNSQGELTGSTPEFSTKFKMLPHDVSWKVLGTGVEHVCAIDANGKLFCWGKNSNGEIGDGSVTSDPVRTPAEVINPDGHRWVDVDAGYIHTCAVDDAGMLWCWGGNDHYQVGQSDNSANYPSPVSVYVPGVVWKSVKLGFFFSCAMDVNNRLWCWGDSPYGQIPSDQPTPVPGMVTNGDGTTWSDIYSAGYDHACAIDSAGYLWCWGRNDNFGQVGNGSLQNVPAGSPAKILNPEDPDLTWKYVKTWGYHTCAIDENDHVWCWGEGDWGMLGYGLSLHRELPERVDDSHIFGFSGKWNMLALGLNHTCGLTDGGEIYCWGKNYDYPNIGAQKFGMLVLGDKYLPNGDYETSPKLVNNINYSGWGEVAAGSSSICGIDLNGKLYCWGWFLSLGIDAAESNFLDSNYVDFPVELPQPDGSWKKVVRGNMVRCGISENNNLFCWGNGRDGALGIGEITGTINYPAKVSYPDGVKWQDVSVGYDTVCAITTDGDLYCWGRNESGEMQSYDFDVFPYPVKMTLPVGVKWKMVSLNGVEGINNLDGYEVVCGITTEDKLYCWGNNDRYFYALPYHKDQPGSYPYPIRVTSPERDWTYVSVGGPDVCAIDSEGQLYCWGQNMETFPVDPSQLNATDYPTLMTLPVGVKWSVINTSVYNTCGLTTDGRIFCWGLSPLFDQWHPKEFKVPFKGAYWTGLSISPGASFSAVCGTDSDYRLYCFGSYFPAKQLLGVGMFHRIYPTKIFGY